MNLVVYPQGWIISKKNITVALRLKPADWAMFFCQFPTIISNHTTMAQCECTLSILVSRSSGCFSISSLFKKIMSALLCMRPISWSQTMTVACIFIVVGGGECGMQEGDSIQIMWVHTSIERTLINAIILHVLTLPTFIKFLSISVATNSADIHGLVLEIAMMIGFPLISFFLCVTNVRIMYKW